MLITQSKGKLIVNAQTSIKDTFLYLGVGLPMPVGGLFGLASGMGLIALIFVACGLLGLL